MSLPGTLELDWGEVRIVLVKDGSGGTEDINERVSRIHFQVADFSQNQRTDVGDGLIGRAMTMLVGGSDRMACAVCKDSVLDTHQKEVLVKQ